MTIQALQGYPIAVDNDLDDVADFANKISQIRKQDQKQWMDLNNQFIAGRKVNKVPASSTDMAGSAIGDFNVTASYAYFCINIGGTGTWVRIAAGTF